MTFISTNTADLVQEIQYTGKYRGKNARAFNVLGRRSSFTSTSALNDIGEGITTALFPTLTGAELIQVISSSANDNGSPAGTGAQTVKVVYINTSYAIVETGDITLNGTTAVTVVASGMLEPLWFEVTSVGSGGVAAGNITLRTSAPVSLSQIKAGGNKSMDAKFMIPDGYTGYIAYSDGSAIQNYQDVRIRALVNTYDRTLSTVYHFQDNRFVPANTTTVMEVPFLKLPARSKVTGATISSSLAAGTRCDITLVIVLIQD